MRKYIISDLHGDGNVYKSVMDYLENINSMEDITLYINGDLIDRGLESADMLLDVRNRLVTGKPFKIEYLGGNHELMMFDVFEKRRKGAYVSPQDDWFLNGGWVTDYGLEDRFTNQNDELEAVDFISNLKIYHKFEEKIGGKPIVLVHASCPLDVKDECNLKIKDGDNIFWYVWAREDDPWLPFRCRIGNDKYFSIVGHTPNDGPDGYIYRRDQNFLNIDGGCARYVSGFFQYNNVPLVEVCNGYLRILIFNNNNQIINGYYFDGNYNIPMCAEELKADREQLNLEFKPKKLVKLPDDIIDYEK